MKKICVASLVAVTAIAGLIGFYSLPLKKVVLRECSICRLKIKDTVTMVGGLTINYDRNDHFYQFYKKIAPSHRHNWCTRSGGKYTIFGEMVESGGGFEYFMFIDQNMQWEFLEEHFSHSEIAEIVGELEKREFAKIVEAGVYAADPQTEEKNVLKIRDYLGLRKKENLSGYP